MYNKHFHKCREILYICTKMKPGMTFYERAILGAEVLAKQRPVTIEEMRAQFLRVRGDFKTQEEALKFLESLSNEEYINYIKGTK